MRYVLYSATGCARCNVVKNYLKENQIPYVERDMKADGKEDFKKFYSANRSSITRGQDGIEFPILTDGEEIRQGIGESIAFLRAGKNLDGFFSLGSLHKEWVDGIFPSSGKPSQVEDFLHVLRYLKKNSMKLQVETDGRNSPILQEILTEGLADTVIMNVVGPAALYSRILGTEVDISDIQNSMALVTQCSNYQFQTTVVPIVRQKELLEISYLTPQEISETAKFIEEGTGSKKNPYLIRFFRPNEVKDERLKSIDSLTSLLSYRTVARGYQVLTEIEKIENS